MGRLLLADKKEEVANASILIDSLKQENISRDDKNKAIAKLKEMYPEMLGNIDLETAGIEKLIEVKRALIKQIFQEAIAKKKAEAMGKIANEIIQNTIIMETFGHKKLEQKNEELE
jgi:phosphoribosylformylglycinamidine (FGAM) synthase PurS component